MILSLLTMAILFWVIFFKATRKLSEQSPYKHPQLAALHRDSAGLEADGPEKASPPAPPDQTPR
jgi:hypothetical protein